MASTIKPLSLRGDTFEALKTDFDEILRNTLSNMENKKTDTAEIGIKLKITTKKESRTLDGKMQDLVIPNFEHAVQSVLQIKNKKGGSLGGNHELVFDEKTGSYVMKFISDGQTSLFDNTDSVEVEIEVIENKDIPELEAAKPVYLLEAALPERVDEDDENYGDYPYDEEVD